MSHFLKEFEQLKQKAGSHSPSIFELKKIVDIKIDACFLSNPYATDLFLSYLKNEDLKSLIEYYPSQNQNIAKYLEKLLSIDKKNIFVGNGATEIIQIILQKFVKNKIVIPIPTFSPYYEFINRNTKIVYYQLNKQNDYILDIEDYINFINKERPNTVVIINPNNPTGAYIKMDELEFIVKSLSFVENIIIDTSFIHFAFENEKLDFIKYWDIFHKFPNVIIIKSMSKDFGIAGLRAGFAIMKKTKIKEMLSSGYLWNINGISEFFFKLLSNDEFMKEYERVRKRYIKDTRRFFNDLSSIQNIKLYPTRANFVLVELFSIKSIDFVVKLLEQYGVYVRTGDDKIGLHGEFVRVASRKEVENRIIVKIFKEVLNV